jgi:two-component system chemotaxis response regulator CheY
MKILVVDDSSTMRRILINTIHTLGSHDIVEAENGADALAKLQESNGADLILTDWNMPVMNGLDFIKNLRQTKGGDRPIVVFCTTENDMTHIQQAIAAGANEYIMKPFDSGIIQSKFAQVGIF